MEFEEINIGQVEKFKHLVTKEEVELFAKLTGDFNPVHMDQEYASKTNFGKRVVHGMLTSSFISTMIGMRIPGKGSLWLSQTLNFLNPTFIGDTIEVIAVVKNIFHSTRTFKLDISITNQNGKKLVEGEALVKMLEKRKKKAIEMKNNIVLITGGNRGIGAATARLLVQKGYFVVVNYKSQSSQAEKLIEELNSEKKCSTAIQADISDPSQVKALFEKIEKDFGAIFKIVHCASKTPNPLPFLEDNWENFESHQNIQLRGAYNLAKCALPTMVENKQGAIVFLGTIFTDGAPPIQQSAYISSKASLRSFAKTLAAEFGPKGIRVNTVNPGMTHTQMLAEIPDKTKLVTKMNTPLKRLAEPEDIANMIDFLLSEKANHITGETLRVSGGIFMS